MAEAAGDGDGRAAHDGATAADEACPNARELALLHQWHALHTGVRRLNDGLLADVEQQAGLAPSSFQALLFLMTAPGQAAPMNQLSQALGFSTAGTTKVVDRLAEAGLVERRPSAADRRVIFTALTPGGARSVLAASRSLAGAVRSRVVEPLGEDVFASLAAAVGSLDPEPDACG
ncbi:DNA-binding transcriptional regulator, MarR family [Actinacidiphila alni]|uniref:DNA-binding transcriptional regulator, MarR family n=1 Tax=Actinacidiphila alni TaxID=380248 RepID=A0A1I1XS82_9ACTN|nr:MarR family winged helix-turn-helix transcriptional regulator [Actinacidiphila alni]SFE10226.1 DNA-binding transcriptional regulator, MarR family [Actinacidiphila alni]